MRKFVVALGLALAVMLMALPVTTPAFAGPTETGGPFSMQFIQFLESYRHPELMSYA